MAEKKHVFTNVFTHFDENHTIPVEPCTQLPSVTDPSLVINVPKMIEQIVAGMVTPIPPQQYFDYHGAMEVTEVKPVKNSRTISEAVSQLKSIISEYKQHPMQTVSPTEQVQHAQSVAPTNVPQSNIPSESVAGATKKD